MQVLQSKSFSAEMESPKNNSGDFKNKPLSESADSEIAEQPFCLVDENNLIMKQILSSDEEEDK